MEIALASHHLPLHADPVLLAATAEVLDLTLVSADPPDWANIHPSLLN